MSVLEWENTTCNWCGSTDAVLLFEGPDRMLRMPGHFRLVRCRCCGLIRQNPRLVWESLKNYYTEDFGSYRSALEVSLFHDMARRYGIWKLLRAIERFQRGGKLLDVGCGTGFFLAQAQRTGQWEVMGIEPVETAAAYARRIVRAPILVGRFSDVELPRSSFDVITMWHVLEHLAEPIVDLSRAHALLRPGGWLVLAIPNLESLAARVFGPYWIGWELPRHLYLFPRKTLRTILTSLGFSVADERCLNLSYAALGHSLEFWLQDGLAQHPLLAQAFLRLYYSWLGRIGLLLPLWVLDRLNLSSIITVFAQKVSDR